MVQTKDIIESLPSFKGWEPHMEEFPGTVNEHGNFINGYKRQVPERFQGDAADEGITPVDKFTQNIITNYAVEVVDKDKYNKRPPLRTHKFVLTKDAAKKVALEVLATHFGLKGKAATDFLNFQGRFEESWKYWDVLDDGAIDAVGSNRFFRHLTKSLGDVDLQ